MSIIHTPAYQKAFVRYLRKGTPTDLTLKAEHPTTHYIWRTAGDGKVRASHAANEGRVPFRPDPGLVTNELRNRCTSILNTLEYVLDKVRRICAERCYFIVRRLVLSYIIPS